MPSTGGSPAPGNFAILACGDRDTFDKSNVGAEFESASTVKAAMESRPLFKVGAVGYKEPDPSQEGSDHQKGMTWLNIMVPFGAPFVATGSYPNPNQSEKARYYMEAFMPQNKHSLFTIFLSLPLGENPESKIKGRLGHAPPKGPVKDVLPKHDIVFSVVYNVGDKVMTMEGHRDVRRALGVRKRTPHHVVAEKILALLWDRKTYMTIYSFLMTLHRLGVPKAFVKDLTDMNQKRLELMRVCNIQDRPNVSAEMSTTTSPSTAS